MRLRSINTDSKTDMSRPQKFIPPIKGDFNSILSAVAMGSGKGKLAAINLARNKALRENIVKATDKTPPKNLNETMNCAASILKSWFPRFCLMLVVLCSGCASVNPNWNDPPPNQPSSNWQLLRNGDTLYSK